MKKQQAFFFFVYPDSSHFMQVFLSPKTVNMSWNAIKTQIPPWLRWWRKQLGFWRRIQMVSSSLSKMSVIFPPPLHLQHVIIVFIQAMCISGLCRIPSLWLQVGESTMPTTETAPKKLFTKLSNLTTLSAKLQISPMNWTRWLWSRRTTPTSLHLGATRPEETLS